MRCARWRYHQTGAPSHLPKYTALSAMSPLTNFFIKTLWPLLDSAIACEPTRRVVVRANIKPILHDRRVTREEESVPLYICAVLHKSNTYSTA